MRQGLVGLGDPTTIVSFDGVPVLLLNDNVLIEWGVDKKPHLLVLTSHVFVSHGGREGVGGVGKGDEVRFACTFMNVMLVRSLVLYIGGKGTSSIKTTSKSSSGKSSSVMSLGTELSSQSANIL